MEEHIDEQPSGEGERAWWISMLPVFVVAAALIVFIAQNTHETGVEFLMLDQSAPTWLIIVISAVAGAVLGQAGAWVRRRGRRNS